MFLANRSNGSTSYGIDQGFPIVEVDIDSFGGYGRGGYRRNPGDYRNQTLREGSKVPQHWTNDLLDAKGGKLAGKL